MMTLSRRMTYRRGWYERECKIDKRKRRREYNRKIRYSEDTPLLKSACTKTGIRWNTVS